MEYTFKIITALALYTGYAIWFTVIGLIAWGLFNTIRRWIWFNVIIRTYLYQWYEYKLYKKKLQKIKNLNYLRINQILHNKRYQNHIYLTRMYELLYIHQNENQ